MGFVFIIAVSGCDDGVVAQSFHLSFLYFYTSYSLFISTESETPVSNIAGSDTRIIQNQPFYVRLSLSSYISSLLGG